MSSARMHRPALEGSRGPGRRDQLQTGEAGVGVGVGLGARSVFRDGIVPPPPTAHPLQTSIYYFCFWKRRNVSTLAELVRVWAFVWTPVRFWFFAWLSVLAPGFGELVFHSLFICLSVCPCLSLFVSPFISRSLPPLLLHLLPLPYPLLPPSLLLSLAFSPFFGLSPASPILPSLQRQTDR